MRTKPNINKEFRRLDDMINNKHIPSFTDNELCRNDEGLLISLPSKLGGMDTSFSQNLGNRIQNSSLITKERERTRENIKNSK